MAAEPAGDLLGRVDRALEEWLRTCSGLPEEAYGWKPARGDWSIKEITFHVADGLDATVQRIGSMLAEETPQLLAFDADQWAAERDYSGRPWAEAAGALEANGSRLREAARGLGPEQLGRRGRHARIAEIIELPTDAMSVTDLLRFEAGHVEGHLADVRELARRFESGGRD
jgi:hypothetical protein